MKTHLQQIGYLLQPTSNVWCKPDYMSIAYSDGDETEEHIASIIAQASDVTVLSNELRRQCTDWPSLYYLSSLRSNILRPFEPLIKGNILEIGAGCGAITRYLGECGASILALEGSYRRASVARSRTRDLSNVTVLAEKFDSFHTDLKFDVITLVGVLEYANLFTEGEFPTLSMLKRVRSLLKPDGKLIIAIENQFGLKYFAGAAEDHVGQPMYGIEGHYSNNDPQTFGRKVITDILQKSDFTEVDFLAPFPDYKLPISIITPLGMVDKHFDAAALAWQSVNRDPQLPLYRNFSPELAWPEIFANHFALDVSNSFLILASSTAPLLPKTNALAFHYSTDRLPQYCKETKFLISESGEIEVIYKKLDSSLADSQNNNHSIIIQNIPNSTPYTIGKPLSLKLLKIISKDNWKISEVSIFLYEYISILAEILDLPALKAKDANIEPETQLSGNYFDLVPQNIILQADGQMHPIDMEWALTQPIELGHLLFRALLLTISTVSRFGVPHGDKSFTRLTFIQGALAAVGIKIKRQTFSRYIDIESRIQEQVTGRPAYDFLDWHPDEPLNTQNMYRALLERDKIIHEHSDKILALQTALKKSEEASARQEDKIFQLITSKSWRITRPIRWAARLTRGEFSEALSPFRKIVRIHPRHDGLPLNTCTPDKKPLIDWEIKRSSLSITKPPVCVILPIYRGIEMTKQCILAAMPDILATQNSVLLAINDSSPDNGMQQMLEDLAYQWPQKLVVLTNQTNRGFVGTVNRGLNYYPQFDVVLLNSDVIVPKDWLQRMITEAYSAPNIATVTPFSNNATICSFPNSLHENMQPFDLDVNEINDVFKLDYLPCIEAPTGVGFCMYIRRACLNEIGYLNEEKFGRGYGEENDLCQRALKKGWRNIISPNLYAFHQGSVSFSTEKQELVERATHIISELHPNYHQDVQAFIAADPLKGARLVRLSDLLAAIPRTKILHISHGLGGGVDQHIVELAEYLKRSIASLVLAPQTSSERLTLRLTHENSADGLTVLLPQNYQDLIDLLRNLDIRAIHFHHAINIDPLLQQLPTDLGVPYYLTIHDYYLLNGNPTLTGKNATFSSEAIDTPNPLYPLPPSITPTQWREQHRALVDNATQVIFPSLYTRRLFEGAYKGDNFIIAPHIEAARKLHGEPKYFSRKNKYTIGALGALSREKGADYLEELAETAKKLKLPFSFTLIGFAYRDLNAVETTGAYQNSELPNLLEEHDFDLIIFPAKCPETYSYTLSSAIESGLPIIAPLLGAFPERLSSRKHVLLFEHTSSAPLLLEKLSNFICALENGKPCSAPDVDITLVDNSFYDSSYLLGQQNRHIDDSNESRLTRRRIINKLLLNPAIKHRTLKENFLYIIWKIYSSASMRWIDNVIPYDVRLRVKWRLSNRPLSDIIKKK